MLTELIMEYCATAPPLGDVDLLGASDTSLRLLPLRDEEGTAFCLADCSGK